MVNDTVSVNVASAAQRALVFVLVALGVGAVVLLAWQLRQVLVLVFLGVLLASAVYQPAEWLMQRGLPAVASVLLVYLAVLVVLAGVLWIVVPPLVGQLVSLVENAPQYVDTVRHVFAQVTARLPGDIGQEGTQGLIDRVSSVLPSLASLATVPLVLLNLVINLVLVVVLSVLFLLERNRLRDGVLAYINPSRRQRVHRIGLAAVAKLGAYVRGQLVMMIAIGVGSGIGMLLIGVPYVLPLAFLAFLTEAIPLVGPVIAGVPIVIIAFVDGGWAPGIAMAAWVVGLQQLEGYVLQPVIQQKALQLSPVITMLAVVAGGALAGIIGALVAIPIVALLQVILTQVVLPLRRDSWERSAGRSGGGDGDA